MNNLDELKQWFTDNPFPTGLDTFHSWDLPENVARMLEAVIGKTVNDNSDNQEILRLLKAWTQKQTP